MDSYKQLEFDKVKRILANLCHSATAKRMSLALMPGQEISQIRQRQVIVSELQEIINRGTDHRFDQISDVKPLFYNYKHLTYSYPEFRKIYCIVKKALEIHSDYNSNENMLSDFPEYAGMVGRLALLPDIKKKFESIFSDEGEVLDTASPALSKLRKSQSRTRQNVLNLLNQKIQDRSLEKIIQDKIITLRDDRYVIPIKEGTIGNVPGIIHGYSGSRATIFVEPNEAIGMNNEIHQLRQEEKEEIFRIMKEFTDSLQDFRDEIMDNYSLLCEMDFYFAAARLGNLFRGSTPRITDRTVIKLKEARHPLLLNAMKDREKVIPFDISLGDTFDILILSGPNTGGKTVTLKSIGLLTLMALCGLAIPASSESEIGLFQHILADIGDQQSLEDSLSTFSAHLRHIQEMLDLGNDKTLVLIDEIGAATDPEQGAALAQAVMEALIERKVTGVVTTHYTPLKLYAMNSERCSNAAMHFDPEKHVPTFRFKIGLPGNSFALEIAEKLGLHKNILQRAKELSGKQNVELTDLLSRISNEKKELSRSKFQYDLKLNLVNQKIREYDEKLSQAATEKKNARLESIKEFRSHLANIQRELGDELSLLKEKEKQEKKKAAQELLKRVSAVNTELGSEENRIQTSELTPVTKPEVGEIVWMKDLDGTGVIASVEKNCVKVEFNGILLVTDLQNLFYQKEVTKEKVTRNLSETLSSGSIKTEIKVLGMTFDDAIPLIETFLDEGFVAGLNKLRIVHGKGTGALRNKIRKYLHDAERVKDYYSPAPEAGGDGVTVVVFK